MNVYDFDGTIYHGDSSIDFYLYTLVHQPAIVRFLPKQVWGFVRYGFKQIDKKTLKEYFFCFLQGIDSEKVVEAFWNKNKQKIYTWYLKQQQSDDVVISASPRFLLMPICGELKINCLIASEVDQNTGKFAGWNCRGEEKVTRFCELFPIDQVEHFYSDSCSDLPMAKIAQKAFFVKKGCLSPWVVSEK